RRAHALRRIAIPTAILQLFTNKTARKTLGGTPEVSPQRERPSVDARFYLALEEWLCAKFLVPAETTLEATHRKLNCGIVPIDAGCAQQLHGEKRWQPIGTIGPMPSPVLTLAGKNFRANALVGDTRARRCN